MSYLVTQDGTPLYYLDEGPRRRSAVVLIHAEPLNSRLWARNIPVLAQSFRVVATDVRGRGDSGKMELGQSIAQFARDLRFVIDSLDLHDVVVVGWSLGSSIVWSYTEQFGNYRLRGHVNVDQSPYRFVSEANVEERRAAVRNDRFAHHMQILRNYVGPKETCDEETLMWMACECMRTHSASHIAAITDSYMSDFRPHLTRMTIPNQLYHATYGTIKPDMLELMRNTTPGCELVYFEHCGHLIPWMHAEEFNRELLQFARRVLPVRPG